MAMDNKASGVSEFYTACRNGDVEFVKKNLKIHSATNDDFNKLEPIVKSTPLHAASYYGHKEIVQLLLEHECDRSRTNGYGLTAYEEATNDEIRQLFHRPADANGTRRFQEENIDECFDFVKQSKEHPEEVSTPIPKTQKTKKRTPSIQAYTTKDAKQLEIGHATTSIALCQSKFGRFVADMFQPNAPMSLKSIGDHLQDIIDKELVSIHDPQSQKASELVNKFLNDDSNDGIQHLIRLYTLETKFYSALKRNPIPLALPLFMKVETLKDRYFQGQSFRGTTMDDDDIAIYKSVANCPESLLQVKHFTSTSIKRSIAEDFADPAHQKSCKTTTNRVLLIFTFSEQCEQAISLCKISDTQPCLSEFENEDEVLILPWTLFHVERVHEESTSSYEIYLSNVKLPQNGLLSAFKWIMRHPKSCIHRFYEHFPEKQPENTVKLITNEIHSIDKDILKKRV